MSVKGRIALSWDKGTTMIKYYSHMLCKLDLRATLKS